VSATHLQVKLTSCLCVELTFNRSGALCSSMSTRGGFTGHWLKVLLLVKLTDSDPSGSVLVGYTCGLTLGQVELPLG
jgi:hypothetical protein